MMERAVVTPPGSVGCAYGCSDIGVSNNVQACSPSDVCSARMNRELQRRARSNSYSTTVSAEGNRLMNERVSHHRVVSDVRRDAQASASRTERYSSADTIT